MSAKYFVDTNVFVYARDASEPEKRPRAEAWLNYLWHSRLGRTSYQVMQEFYVTVTAKLRPPMPLSDARADVRDLTNWNPLPPDLDLLERAWQTQDQFGLSWWDSMIVSSALAAGCEYLLTEDLQDGQRLYTLSVVNPFRLQPPD